MPGNLKHLFTNYNILLQNKNVLNLKKNTISANFLIAIFKIISNIKSIQI